MAKLFPVECVECKHPVGYSFSPPVPHETICNLCAIEFSIVHHTLMIFAGKFVCDMENDLRHLKNNYNSNKRREEYGQILIWQKQELDRRTKLQIEELVLDNSKQID